MRKSFSFFFFFYNSSGGPHPSMAGLIENEFVPIYTCMRLCFWQRDNLIIRSRDFDVMFQFGLQPRSVIVLRVCFENPLSNLSLLFIFRATFFPAAAGQLIELRRNPQGAIEKRGARTTVKPTLATNYKTASQNENSVYHVTKVRNSKLRKELRSLDDQIQVKTHRPARSLVPPLNFGRTAFWHHVGNVEALLGGTWKTKQLE